MTSKLPPPGYTIVKDAHYVIKKGDRYFSPLDNDWLPVESVGKKICEAFLRICAKTGIFQGRLVPKEVFDGL